MANDTDKSILDYAIGKAPDVNTILPLLAIAPAIFFRAGKFRRLFASGLNNFLKGFYGKGVGQLGKGVRFAKEVGSGSASLAYQTLSPWESFAFKQTGMSRRTRRLIAQNERDRLNTLADFKNGNLKFEEAKSIISRSELKSHFKLTNDYRNNVMYHGDPSQKEIARYINRIGMRKGQEKFIKFVGADEASALHGPDTFKYMQAVHKSFGGKPINFDSFALYHEMPIQQVLRGIQFEPQVWSVMQDINAVNKMAIKNGKVLEPSMVKSILKENGLKPQITEIGSRTRIHFNISPRIKSNYDWGGYNGTSVWDTRYPSKIQFSATDRPDVFSIKLGGKEMLNISSTKMIEIPEAKKIIRKMIDDSVNEGRVIAGINKRVEEAKMAGTSGIVKPYDRELYDKLKKYHRIPKDDKVRMKKLLDKHDDLVKGVRTTNEEADWNTYVGEFAKNRAAIGTGVGIAGYNYLNRN